VLKAIMGLERLQLKVILVLKAKDFQAVKMLPKLLPSSKSLRERLMMQLKKEDHSLTGNQMSLILERDTMRMRFRKPGVLHRL